VPALVAVALHAATEKDANLKALHELVLAAIRQGPDVVVAPECAMYGAFFIV
jgi:predicted amidohydrolase